MDGNDDCHIIQVVSAVILRNGRALLQQRSPFRDFPMTWECTGGKVKHGETLPEALHREVCEELSVYGNVGDEIASFIIKLTDRSIRITFFHVDIGLQCPELPALEAEGIGWFSPAEVRVLDMTPGNALLREQLARLCERG